MKERVIKMEDFEDILIHKNPEILKENANADGYSPSGLMANVAATANKAVGMDHLPEDIREEFRKGYIHIHDFDYYMTRTTTCSQLPLDTILKDGFSMGNGKMREPKSIKTAASLAAKALLGNQITQHGGQAIPNFDFDLAKYVKLTYDKLVVEYKELGVKNYKQKAMQKTEEETYQAMEAFIHDCNTLVRAGGQTPFISVNFGLDISKWGKMVSKNLLKAQKAGIGDNDTPIFPILILKVKEGVNFNQEDPNYDLYELSLECLSKRLFPNFQFVDASFNVNPDSDDPKDAIATMGCRTRVFEDINGDNTPVGRGNLSFTTINLPMVGAKVKFDQKHDVDFDTFTNEEKYKLLEKEALNYVNLVVKQLLIRYEFQREGDPNSFGILYKETWKDKHLADFENHKIGDALKTGGLSVGFIGLAETLKLVFGKHHGESEEMQKYGLRLIQAMSDRCKEFANNYNLNISLLATPAEGLSFTSVTKFKKIYGVIENVSDRDFFTNSNHVPVYYNISAKRKIDIEAPYHELTLAGHILYIEVDGNASSNIQALDELIRYMASQNVGYGSINVPLDKCLDCGYDEYILGECPRCGSRNISRIRRITGYLVGDMDKWNAGKKAEEANRVKHLK